MACPAPEAFRPTTGHLREVVPDEPDYLQFAGAVSGAVARVARRYRLNPTEIEDLESDVWVKLLADRGRALRRFRGAARISTYLGTVAVNVLRDCRNREWGKWRPSAAAVRGGQLAITVDRLISRDGLTVDQACEWLRSSGIAIEHARVDAIAATLPHRCRRVRVGVGLLESHIATNGMIHETACPSDARRDTTIVGRQLEAAIRALPEADRNLLAWRYFEGRTVAEIASALRVNQKQLYRRFQHVLEQLRRMVDLDDGSTLMDALVSGDRLEIAIQFPAHAMPAAPGLRRSA